MGLLADLYLSQDDQEAVRYDEQAESFADRLQFTSFTELELSTLWASLRNEKWDVSSLDEFTCVFQEPGGEISIHRLPTAMIDDLAGLDSQNISVVASKWAATDDVACEPDDVRPIIEGLVGLALKASQTGKGIYLWNCI